MFDRVAETMSRDERSMLQTQRLRALVDRLLSLDGLQGHRLRQAGVDSAAELTPEDLPRLPFTTKADLWDNYPLGLLAVPPEDVVAVHGSSGTGGRPTLVGYTRADLDVWAQMCARSLGCGGATKASVVHNAYGYGLFTGGAGLHQGAIAMGATVVPNSAGMTARQVKLLVDLQPDILCCTPSYAVYLGEAVREAGVDHAQLNLKAGILGAEPWTGGLREKIEALLPLKALDIYGLSEIIGPGVATECIEAQDGLHVNEDHFLVECIDPVSGTSVGAGQVGELVFTTLTKQALPFVRYRSADLASLDTGDCPCGRTLVRMSKVVGRRDDMLVIRGVNVFPSEIEQVVLSDRRVAPQYFVVVDKRSDTPRLVVACEQVDGGEEVHSELEAALAARLGLRADIRMFPIGSLPRQEVGKVVRVLTWAGAEPPLPGL